MIRVFINYFNKLRLVVKKILFSIRYLTSKIKLGVKSKLDNLNESSYVIKISTVFVNDIDLTVRRFLSFAVDVTVIYSLLYIIEILFCAYIIFNEIDYIRYSEIIYSNSILLFSHKYFHWVMYFVYIGHGLSRKGKGTLGTKIFKIKLKTSPSLSQSLIASYLRVILPFFIPYAFLSLVLFPYANSTLPRNSPTIEIMLLLALIMIWPISIILTRGKQSIYEYFLGIQFEKINNTVYVSSSSKEVVLASILTILVSFIATSIYHFDENTKLVPIYAEKTSSDIKTYSYSSDRLIQDIERRLSNQNIITDHIHIGMSGGRNYIDDNDGGFVHSKTSKSVSLIMNKYNSKADKQLVEIVQKSMEELNYDKSKYNIIFLSLAHINIAKLSITRRYVYNAKDNSYSLDGEYLSVETSHVF